MKKEITSLNQRILTAEEGKTIAHKDGTIFGPVLWLGINAIEEDYIEIDIPEEPTEEEQ